VPSIDVNEVILGGDIAGEAFQVIRRRQTMVDGMAVEVETLLTGMVGAIAPTGDNSLVRAEGFTEQNETLQVVTNFMLRGPSRTADDAEWMADLVVWQGSRYIVRTVNNFSQYGRGFIQAECLSFDYVDLPPSKLQNGLGQLIFTQANNAAYLGVI
jgi:galactose-6-phosphate isomerase